jgi:hypothetical protein
MNELTGTIGSKAPDSGKVHGRRDDFLLEMYKECSGHLDRHVSSVWECFAVLVVAATAVTVDHGDLVFDYAIAFAIVVCIWFGASNIDASSWFNRNITIIANIERLFLDRGDAKLVHRHFLRPLRRPKMVRYFKVHFALAMVLAVGLLLMHLQLRLSPLGFEIKVTEAARLLPAAVFIVGLLTLVWIDCAWKSGQTEDNIACPGMDISEDQQAQLRASTDAK